MSHIFNTFDAWLANTNPETVAMMIIITLMLVAAATREHNG